MVKRSGGGTKRKAKMEKIANKEYLATAFSKRTYGLYSKISQLCLLSHAQIAVLATPPSSHSNVSFFSFGHSSVDAIVSAYLQGQSPIVSSVKEEETREDVGICMARKELGLGFWWEDDEFLASSKINPDELIKAINSMSTLLQKFQDFHSGEEADKSDNETLVSDDLPVNFNDNALSGSLDQEMEDIDQLIDFNSFETSDFDHLFTSNDKSDLPDQTLNSSTSCIHDTAAFNDDVTKFSNFNEIIEEQTEPDQTLVSPIRCDDENVIDFNNMTEEQSRQIIAFCESISEEATVDELPSNEEDQRRFLEICESLWV